ncbi:hypothetical protein EAH_00059180 [Eimeria acervulina]|uniref:WD domain, G-beta repeat-containing protein n=1 Tax=Eimeria acervulina TaxID=5801 RepID=U6GNI8_EIMAC|nr:hypothetical protein EAH_00059180 [Eimeria acervulina]CDI81132.1 hypothetical protein EAH_00059180 [Eimeria acervulina]
MCGATQQADAAAAAVACDNNSSSSSSSGLRSVDLTLRAAAVGSGWEGVAPLEGAATAAATTTATAAAAEAAATAAADGGALQWAKLLPDGSGICAVFADGLLRFFATPEALSGGGLDAVCDREAAAGAPAAATATAAAAAELSPWLELAVGETLWDMSFPPDLFHQQGPDSCCCAVSAIDHPEWQLGTRRSKGSVVQKGMISAIAAMPSSSSSSSSAVACGSQGGTIGLYDVRSSSKPLLFSDPSCPSGAVAQLLFADEGLLLSGHRQDPVIRCWELRAPRGPLFKIERSCNACSPNKTQFDVKQQTLVVGSQDGSLSFFSLATGREEGGCLAAAAAAAARSSSSSSSSDSESSSWRSLTNSPIAAVFFHPQLPLLFTAHSERTFFLGEDSDDCSSSSSNSSNRAVAAANAAAVRFNWAIGLWSAAGER